MIRRMILAIASWMIALGSALAAPPPGYYVDQTKLPFDAIANVESSRSWGVHNGAGYRIEVPTNWNGTLVMWAHGFRGTGLELTVDNHPLRTFLVANGYAWAASSYSKNDYDPAQGAKDTHALTNLFNGKFAKPKRTYITGASMGGHITGIVAEQWPGTYAGAMPICGVMGDYELFDYFLDFNLAAQTLSGQQEQYPFGSAYLSAVVPATKTALGQLFPFQLNQEGTKFRSLVELRSGGVRPMFQQGFLYWNGVVPNDFLFGLGVGDGTLPRTPGVAVQNSDVVYQFDTNVALSMDEMMFNNNIQRVTADRQGRHRNGLANVPPTTGDLKIPMLTLHTLGDLFVPFHMEQEYARRVAAKGNAQRLVQRATRDFGHCSFTPTELVTTFVDLVKWVEAGVKPAGDDVLNPAAVADPQFGCTFTDKTSARIWDNPNLVFLKPPVCNPTP